MVKLATLTGGARSRFTIDAVAVPRQPVINIYGYEHRSSILLRSHNVYDDRP
jgi:hypothetical protein